MKTIILEEHISTERFLEATPPPQQPEGAMAEFVARTNRLLLETADERVAAMDQAGIDVQVLSFSGVGLNNLKASVAADFADEANDRMANMVAAHPARFAAFAAVAPQEPQRAAETLERCVRNRGFVGTMIHGTVGGEFLDHSRYLPIFEAADSLDVPVYLHPARPPRPVQEAYFADLRSPLDNLMSMAGWGWHVETGLHALRLIVSGLFDRLPGLKIIIGHMGEDLPYSIARADDVLTRATKSFLRRPVKEYFLDNFRITTSGYFTLPPFLCAREVMGINRILFSVDYPYSAMSRGIDFLSDLKTHLSEDELTRVASGNAETILRLKRPDSSAVA